MKSNILIHWTYDRETLESPRDDILLNAKDKTSICIDTDVFAESVLRILLNKFEIPISEQLQMRIHLWSVPDQQDLTNKHYFFINDKQNDLIKSGFITACTKS